MKPDVRVFLVAVLGLGLGLALVLVGSLPVTAEGLADFDLTDDCPLKVGDVAVLIKAIEMANGTRAADTITLAPGCRYTLDTPEVGAHANATGLTPVSTTITINGQGSTIQRASRAADAFRIFHVTSDGSLHLKELTIRNGEAEFGGGIYSEGVLELIRCTVDGNLGHNGQSGGSSQGFGGGIWSSGHLTLTQSTVSNNEAHSVVAGGGGLYLEGTGVAENCTFSGNSVSQALGGNGGGIFLAGQLDLRNCTVANNQADAGGGIHIGLNRALNLWHTLIANNSPENCHKTNTGPLTIIASVQYGGNDATSCGSLLDVLDPNLGALADNGGGTHTMALLPGSAVIDYRSCSSAAATDQRGVPRPQGPKCDCGAYEAQPELVVTKSSSEVEVEPGDVVTFAIVVDNQGAGWATNAVILDPLPLGLTFIGPITLEPPSAGAPQSGPPLLAHSVTVTPGESVTVTFPVMVSGEGPIINTVQVTSDEVLAPVTDSVVLTTGQYRVFLPTILRK